MDSLNKKNAEPNDDAIYKLVTSHYHGYDDYLNRRKGLVPPYVHPMQTEPSAKEPPTSAEGTKYKWTILGRILYPFALLAVIAPPVLIAYVVINIVFFSGDPPETPESRQIHKLSLAVEELSKGDQDKFYDYMDEIYGRGIYADPPGVPTKDLR
jgi:hypothetical protein